MPSVYPTGCPRCGEPAPTGSTCGGCRRVLHPECARAFGACPCGASLDPPGRGPGQDLPRLLALARRVTLFDGEGLPPEDGPLAVCLAPAPAERRADPRAAEAVGSVLGTSPADGLQRLGSPVPEPLVRVPDRESALAVEHALRDVAALTAFTLPLRSLLGPLEAFEVEQVDLGTTTTYKDAAGQERSHRFGQARLVVTAPYLQARRAASSTSARLTPSRPTLRVGKPEASALVFLGADPVPLFLRESAVKDWSCLSSKMTMVPAQNVEILARELGQGGGELRPLPRELGQEPWLTRLAGLEDRRENAALVFLAARLLHRQWVLEKGL